MVAQAAPVGLTPQEQAWLQANLANIEIKPTYELPPLESIANGEYHGIAADYVAFIGTRLGVEFRYRPHTPSSGLDPSRVDLIPLVDVRARAPDFEKLGSVHLRLGSSLLVRRSDAETRSLDNLRGRRVGVDSQMPGWRELERHTQGMQFIPVQDSRRGLSMLSFGDLDGLVTLLVVAIHGTQVEGITNLRNVGPLDHGIEFVMAVRPPGSPLAGILDKAVRSLTEADHLAIQRRWVESSAPRDWSWLFATVGVLATLLLGAGLWNRSLVRRVARRTQALQHELAERTRVESALRESEELHRASLVEISDAVFLTDEDGVFRYMSPDLSDRLGVAPQAVASWLRIDDLLGADLLAELRAGHSVQDARVVIQSGHGVERVLRVHAKSTRVFGRSLLFACRDVTAQERAAQEIEAQRRVAGDAHRMAALGALVSTLAHEVNNPNHTIMLNVPVLRAAWQDSLAVLDQHARTNPSFRLANIPYDDMRDDVLRLVDEIHQGADRIRGIVVGLRNYARGHSQQPERVELAQLLHATVAHAKSGLDAASERFTVAIETPLPAVRAHPLLLTQVFVGLLDKAVLNLTDRSQGIALRAGVTGDGVVVEVHDEGPAVPEAEVVNVTKPFQKTGGSLDIAIAAWIVQQFGGSVTIRSEPGKGTLVRVELRVWGEATGQRRATP